MTDRDQDLHLQILLKDGHVLSVTNRMHDPEIVEFLNAYASTQGSFQSNQLIQLFDVPSETMVAFPAETVSSLKCTPPVDLRALAQAHQSLDTGSAQGNDDTIIPSRVLRIDGFLTAEENRNLIDFTITNQSHFKSSSVESDQSDPSEKHRDSLVWFDFDPWLGKLRKRIQKMLPDLFRHFDLEPFDPTQIECQMTAHNDGHYYQCHNDNGAIAVANRRLTFVYYYHGHPKGFSGGNLRMYDSRIVNNTYQQAADHYTDYEPSNNSIVFFLPHCLHEVMTVHCPSRAFKDCRYTINGWIWE